MPLDELSKLLEETKYVPKKISEQEVPCPSCGSSIKLEVYVHEAPYEGHVLLLVATCPQCGYKYREATPSEYVGKPVEIRFRIEGSDDLRCLFYKSPYAYVRIPSLGIEVIPGPASYGEITTLEGYLMKIAEVLYPLCDSFENAEKCYDVVSKLITIANGDLPCEVLLIDPSGLSTVIRKYRNNVEVKILSEEELKEFEAQRLQLVVKDQRSTQP